MWCIHIVSIKNECSKIHATTRINLENMLIESHEGAGGVAQAVRMPAWQA
jgi:hypothetical protein